MQVVIVDHPLVAEALSVTLQQQMIETVVVDVSEVMTSAPPNALVLLELALPEHRSGLNLARELRQGRPDLIDLVWTLQPGALYIWAGLEYKINGFLDKAMPLAHVLYWFDHAMNNGMAWPAHLVARARQWDEMAMRLRSLPGELWLLWIALLRGVNVLEMADRKGWSRRTIERRLAELYATLGVHSRPDVINMAWKHQLVHEEEGRVCWSHVVSDLLGGISNDSLAPPTDDQGGSIFV